MTDFEQHLITRDTSFFLLSEDTRQQRRHKDKVNRIYHYLNWLDNEGRHWLMLDMVAYRDHLLKSGLAPISVRSYLAAIRARYQTLMDDHREAFEKTVFSQLSPELDDEMRQQLVREIINSVQTQINPRLSRVEEKPKDATPSTPLAVLSAEEASELLRQPGMNTRLGMRDTAVLAMLLCTGIRIGELIAIEVEHLEVNDMVTKSVGLFVPSEDGEKQDRVVPYFALDWVLPLVRQWLAAANITEGKVFRAFYKTGETVRDRLSVRGLEFILKAYPIKLKGKLQRVTPFVLRRTYANLMYEAGMDLGLLAHILGIGPEATREYLVRPSKETFTPTSFYQPPFDLNDVQEEDNYAG